MKRFKIPAFYQGKFISPIKRKRSESDRMKKDLSPTQFDLGKVKINLARHFGFCYGVENAIERAYRAVEENPGKNIYLLSEIVHNSLINTGLFNLGIRYIMNTSGKQLIPWEKITSDDIVIIPAFGTTVEMIQLMEAKGIDFVTYDSTCPFVERVWNKAAQIGQDNYTIIIHGNPRHEETLATFSHSLQTAPAVIVRDMNDALLLAGIIKGDLPPQKFYELFAGRYSPGFNVKTDLVKIGVVNQTTLIASETNEIIAFLRQIMMDRYDLAEDQAYQHFADTRDTICYATYDNQSAALYLANEAADLAIVIGGYNSVNTAHLVELMENYLPTYFIFSDENLISANEIRSWDIHDRKMKTISNYLPEKESVTIHITGGASTPDVMIERVINRLLLFYHPDDIDSHFNDGLM
ncbi:4-hydroxy-3-methylbut-2-enyl diphosphate reductase [Chitinophaga solisilvae]|uniref:4-hydroxy-3-methylbut-2-enyl diphosphate reductase n=1 Tax=Chitinophaga solisilvae TaxID=1233460 RepID=UPI001367AA9E|nr:4-hydroxy-3-methylbut-2-enyl diphosphate reductase [Chitinophaga solisilvae]